jgi:hypothetical protein
MIQAFETTKMNHNYNFSKILILMCALLVFDAGGQAYAAHSNVIDFVNGSRKFSTAGHPKSKGLNIEVSYPSSWLAKEGERPNIVQKFTSDGGRGLEMALIVVMDLQLPKDYVPSENEIYELLSSSAFKGSMPNATFKKVKRTRIDGIPAGIIEYSVRTENAGMALVNHFTSYVFIYRSTMVQFTCSVFGSANSTAKFIENKTEEFRLLFSLMANSIVVQSKWE